ncbi:hypothetical protein [Halorussus sp. AFM4]|uniref:hypothetical protein n=1 Tax=Halorussus sp. AFM4 TaxID=3421651 RepID=UPI003EBC0D6B
MTDDRSDALDRVRRAKAGQPRDRWLDGGAVAAGLVAALGPQTIPAFAVAVSLPRAVATGLALATLLTVPVGAYVAGYLGGPGGRRGARHGGVAVAAAVVLGAAASVWLTGGEVAGDLGSTSFPAAAVLATAAGGLVGGLAGALGGRRRGPDAR